MLKRRTGERRKVGLVGLIDLIFLLLIFFLLTTTTSLGRQDQRITIPVPLNEQGQAQVLIQVVDNNRYVYLDERWFDSADSVLAKSPAFSNEWYRMNPSDKSPLFKRLLTSIDRVAGYPTQMNRAELDECMRARLGSVVRENNEAIKSQSLSGRKIRNLFLVVRCPPAFPYGSVIGILNAIKDIDGGSGWLQFGTAEGTINDLTGQSAVIWYEPPPNRHIEVRYGA